MKTRIQLAIIFLCLFGAGIILYCHRPNQAQGLESIPLTRQVWVECRNCNDKKQIGERDFIRKQQTALEMMGHANTVPGVICSQCQAADVVLTQGCLHDTPGSISNSDPNHVRTHGTDSAKDPNDNG